MNTETSHDPLVSILIPCYNREDFIAECINSAINQSYKNIEIIICDNASTDRTYKICKDLAKIDNRIKVFKNDQNVGPVLNWYKCAEKSSGNYVKILFSDDILLENFLEKTIDYIKTPEIGFVSTAAIIGDEPRSTQSRIAYSRPFKDQIVSTDIYLKALSSATVELPYSPGAALFRRKDFLDNLMLKIDSVTPTNFNENGAGPDVLIFLITAQNYPKVAFLEDPLVFFRVHSRSISIENHNNNVSRGYQRALAWYFNKYQKPNLLRNWIAVCFLGRVKTTKSATNIEALERELLGDSNIASRVLIIMKSIAIYTNSKIKLLISNTKKSISSYF